MVKNIKALKKKKKSNENNNEMGFRPSAQYCKNVGTLIQCGECENQSCLHVKVMN